VVMVWCTRCESKDLIASHRKGRHWKWMTSETHKQWLVEALACPCEHPNVIKFLATHIETMEAYTLWWNGGTFKKCWITSWNISPLLIIIPYCKKVSWIWKGEHDLSPLGEIMWSWHGHT
jgi:hypothetical protein